MKLKNSHLMEISW